MPAHVLGNAILFVHDDGSLQFWMVMYVTILTYGSIPFTESWHLSWEGDPTLKFVLWSCSNADLRVLVWLGMGIGLQKLHE